MAEPLTIRRERVDDLPVLVAQRDRMGGPPRLDEHLPPQGNWGGLSRGWVTVVWLTSILAEADQRLNHVEPWAEQRLHPLRGGRGQRVDPLDLSDDRLAAVLEALSDATRWQACEGAWPQQVWRVYALPPERVGLDTTTASGSWRVTEAGLLQCGHSTDHRPDLPPVKGMLSGLDPLGVPVAMDVVPGQRAAAPLYIPAIAPVRESVGGCGLVSVGEGTMAALETRASRQAGGEGDLCPLAETPLPPAELAGDVGSVSTGHQPLTRLTRLTATGTRQHLADGDERLERLSAEGAGTRRAWPDRRLGVRSRQLTRAGETARRARLARARAAVTGLNDRGRGKRRFPARPALQGAVETSLARYRVLGLLAVQYIERVRKRWRRRDGGRPPTVPGERDLRVKAVLHRAAVATAVGRLGWRVYATNVPAAPRSRVQAVLASRSQDLGERAMGRRKGHPLSLTPMDLERDDQAPGVSRLVAVGVRVLTLLACVVRQRLAAARTVLIGRYTGHPKRATARPTTARLLNRFEGLPLTLIREGRRRRSHLTPLSRGQRPILTLLTCPVDIYPTLCPDSPTPP